MLIRFEVANYRSIDQPVELSMVAVDRDREQARDTPLLGERLLTLAAVFGPNASGKSNLLAALSWLRNAVQHSLRQWEDEIPVEPFAFGDGPSRTTEFTLESTVDGVRFEYVLELDSHHVAYEGLFHYPERKRKRIFEREGSDLKLQRGLGGLAGTRDLLTDTTLALSVARRFDEPLVTDFARDLVDMQTLGQQPHHQLLRGKAFFDQSAVADTHTALWFEDTAAEPESRQQVLALLRLADLGIEDVLIDKREVSFGDAADAVTWKQVRLLHRTGQNTAPLDFHTESEGTRTWFRLIGPVLTALRRGSVVIFDELDASLHPTLSAELLHIFDSPTTNPRGAQLIFTSHDTSLLNHLNRDEVWLTEKRDDGSTRLGALAEFAGERVRRSQNLENAYLHGRFGALPQIDQTELLRTLGLIG